MRAGFVVVGVVILARSAGATEVVRGPVLVHPDDGFVYVPQDAAFPDADHVLVAYTRGQEGSLHDSGAFVRSLDVDTGAFSAPIRLDSDARFAQPRLDAPLGGGGARVLWLQHTDTVLPGNVNARHIMLAKVGVDGQLVGTHARVNDTDAAVASIDLAMRSDGTTLVVWWELQNTNRRAKVFARFFDEDLAPLGAEFKVRGDFLSTFPRVEAGPTYFTVACRDGAEIDQSHVITLDDEGAEVWRLVLDGEDPTVTALSNGSVYVGYHRRLDAAVGDDAFIRLLDGDTGDDIGGEYRVSLPRESAQQNVTVASSLGVEAVGAWGSFARNALGSPSGMLDFIKLDALATPVDADGALVDNTGLTEATREFLPNQDLVVAGGPSDVVAVIYNAEQYSDLLVGRRAKMLLLRAGVAPCPEGVTCSGLVPFHITGPAERRLNILIRPSLYGSMGAPFANKRRFLRQLRDTLLSNITYGGRQHRQYGDRLNFLVKLEEAGTPCPLSSIGCLAGNNLMELEETYPWIYAMGAQRNQNADTGGCAGDILWCASPGLFANGGGAFNYPGTRTHDVFEHELAHVAYATVDEYVGGQYAEPAVPRPFPTQYPDEQACRDDATAEGWDPNDCVFFCDVLLNPSCGISWWKSELPDDTNFATVAECQAFIEAKNIADRVDGCAPASPTGYTIPALRDLMGGSATQGDPAQRTEDHPYLDKSFQRGCERRVLNVLTDPGLYP